MLDTLAEIEFYAGFSGGMAQLQAMRDATKIVLAELRRLMALENNAPLTLDELREMDGEPVWVKVIDHTAICEIYDCDGWGLCRKSWVRVWNADIADLYHTNWDFKDYCISWLAYRNKPKEEIKE